MAKKAKKSKAKACREGCGKCLKAVTKLTIANYFLASGILYVACAFVVNIQYVKVEKFLCNVWAQRNDTGDFGKGCLECGFDNIFCGKSECWHDAINLTYKEDLVNATPSFIQEWMFRTPDKVESATFLDASVDVACNEVLTAQETPVKAILTMASLSTQATTDTSVTAVTEKCVQFHCKVVQRALEHPDLMRNPQSEETSGCTNTEKVKRHWNSDYCVCHGLYQTMTATDITTIENYCSFTFKTTSTTTTTTTTSTTTTTTTIIAASARRLDLDADMEDIEENANCDKQTADKIHDQAPDVGSLVDMADDLLRDAPMRALQAAPATAPAAAGLENKDLQDYEVGAWSKCACYQQCVSGVMTRSVKCLAQRCKDPKPPTLESCQCGHCADCTILLNLTIFFYLFQVQGFVALFVWVNFLWLNSLQEANFVKSAVSYLRWFLGIWVKLLPLLVRLCLLMNIIQIVVMTVQTWLPGDVIAFAPDCNASRDLRVLDIILLGVLVAQICMGVLTRLTNRMPPFLYRPVTPSRLLPFRLLSKSMRFLGP